MADLRHILPGNIDGNFFVDSSCIDCDLCRQIAPGVFVEDDGYSIVSVQPHSKSKAQQAAKALVVCPTASIGTRKKIDLKEALGAYPELIEDSVYFCGFASRDSYGAKSYLIVRPEGNVLVDSPRFTKSLVEKIEELGGVRTMFLSHQDDIADHEKFHSHFGCERIIHRDESRHMNVERYLTDAEPSDVGTGLLAIPTPGHTRGHAVLLFKNKFLFTGDHLAWSEHYGHLIAFHRHNWYSWPETIRSMERLKNYRFEWILPGHGRSAHSSPNSMSRQLRECVEWMKGVA